MKSFDITNQRFGLLVAKKLVPYEQRKTKKKTREWVCECDCGNIIHVEQRLLLGKVYGQQSCGCIRIREHFFVTNKMGLSREYIYGFEDFAKFAFLHRALTHIKGKSYVEYDIDEYKSDIAKFYNDLQFNSVYVFWKNNEHLYETFYNWIKPSIDHIIPVSRGGSHKSDNLQFLTVYENLAKRDMTMYEWQHFKQLFHATNELFIENLMQKGGKDSEL